VLRQALQSQKYRPEKVVAGRRGGRQPDCTKGK